MKNLIKLTFTLAVCAIASLAHAGPNQDLADWCVNRMRTWAPPGKSFYPDAKETEDEGVARYRAIVADAMAVVYDPTEAPIFSGADGRAKTLAVVLSIADSESGFRKDVDLGLGKYGQGDGGRSWCMMQIQLSTANPVTKKTFQRIALKGDSFEYTTDPNKGFGGEDLVSNRQSCFRVGLHMVRNSFKACAANSVENRLAVYATGRCDSGWPQSAVRVGKAIRWFKAAPPPADDATVMAALAAPTVVATTGTVVPAE